MIQILNRYDWTWAGLLVSDDDYGLHAARSFQSDFVQSGGGCLAYVEILPWGNDPAEIRRIVDVMKKSTARVVIGFAHESHMINLMEEVGLDIKTSIWHNLIPQLNDLIAKLRESVYSNISYASLWSKHCVKHRIALVYR